MSAVTVRSARVVVGAVMMTIGVTADGGWEMLGLEVGDSEDGAFWTALVRGLHARGPAHVKRVVSNAR